jgi:hypothetical protein
MLKQVVHIEQLDFIRLNALPERLMYSGIRFPMCQSTRLRGVTTKNAVVISSVAANRRQHLPQILESSLSTAATVALSYCAVDRKVNF